MRVLSLSRIWNDSLPQLLAPGVEFQGLDAADGSAVWSELPAAEILISIDFTQEMAAAAKRLRLLICPAAGTEHIDRSALRPDIRFAHGSGHEIPMAEYVIGCLVALRQHLFAADAALRRGEWVFGYWGGAQVNEELAGSALGLIGFGGIGRAVQRRARPFDIRCAAVTLHPEAAKNREHGLEFLGRIGDRSDVDRLVSWCDALVLCCELSDLTRGLLDARRLALMKRDALVVNVARGPVADERALYEALKERRIAGAALDVWYRYPPENAYPAGEPFWELQNVIMTPHASAWTEEAKQRRLREMARLINEFARTSARA